ncbi:DNA-methyltransferase [Clostridium perfringens]|uniref:DNA-methyltransferase n=1 Tax=Clostridium perfringens TaxID=1502 RepID=UPI001E5043D4|nr:site-specific DNA-methyltransferase [Clostridium perfringens]WVL78338.1 site-specific DNA-methyltransferase [Clostridium perfringens]
MYKLFKGDCLDVMKEIQDKSVDMVLCDLPYGTTACKWDSIIPFEQLWEQYNRIVKDNGAIVLFGSQPFTSKLICSNIKNFKSNYIWEKEKGSNFLNANKQVMRFFEDICVFYRKQPVYNPQKVKGKPYHRPNSPNKNKGYVREFNSIDRTYDGYRHPSNILRFNRETGLHPAQKPVKLLEYLIKTYTNGGDVVLDNCMGSGSTGVACLNTGRNFIGIELDDNYFNIAKNRIEEREKEIINGNL